MPIKIKETDCLAALKVLTGLILVFICSLTLWAQGPALTTISDTVYRADGTAAAGTALITWPSFESADGYAVTAGNLSVTLGAQGAFVAQLVPNVGATPAGTYYVVVFQLDDGTVRTEYWAVPSMSPSTISAVITTPGTGLTNLAATQQYVNAAVAPLAVDTTVVHLTGAETITGTKQFVASPSLPAPVTAADAATKGYVDQAVQTVGSGSYVPIAGGTMTGPLTLPGDPTAPYQASDRNYVDNGLLAKADLVSGTVPAAELGAGVASSATCLNGNSTWGPCGSGAPAGITYATALNWTQTLATPLTGGSSATVTLSPCPVGIDTTSGAGYQLYLSGGGNSEAVSVIGGTCASGASSGTITFTPYYSYSAGYTIGSASSGIQETINAACGVSGNNGFDIECNVTIPANGPYLAAGTHSLNNYNVYGTIFLHTNQSILSGYGVSLNCMGRDACLQVGDLLGSNHYNGNTVSGLAFRAPTNLSTNPSYAGVTITQTCLGSVTGSACNLASGVAQITTSSPHGFRVGDMVTIMFTDDPHYWGDAIVTAVPTSTTFQYSHPKSGSISSQSTPGLVALAYVAVLDNSTGTHFSDITYDRVYESGHFNNFFDMWDDENATIDHFNNQGIPANYGSTWFGSFVYSGGALNTPSASQQLAPVITFRDSTITANYSNGITVYNSNGLYIEDSVIQATGLWAVYSANTTGNYQGAAIKNIYTETGLYANNSNSPFPNLGVAGLIAGASSGTYTIAGNGGTSGFFPTGGTGTTPYTYYIVANDTTAGRQTSPMQILNWLSTGSDSIPVRWPRIANGADVITYDVIRMGTPAGIGSAYPYIGGCTGGTGGACGYVAQGLTQAAACAGGLVCSYTDTGSSATSSYTIKPGTYQGPLNFWPGSIVAVAGGVSVDKEQVNVVGLGLYGNPLQYATSCYDAGVASPGGYTSCLASITPSNNSIPNQTATILTDGDFVGGGNVSLSKGRLNFSSTSGSITAPHHVITLLDSQPSLTQSTWGYRPPASPFDTWIGLDMNGNASLNQGQLAFGSPVSITNYIQQTGNGNNWLERLTANVKTFNVPVQFNQNVTLSGLSNGCLNVAGGVIGSTGSPCGSGGGGGSVSSIFGRTGTVVAQTGDYSVGQVTGAAVDSAVVHLANTETISGAKIFSNTITASGNLVLPQGSGFVPAVGGIGIDTAANMPVVNLGGTTQQVALTSSNISGQAGTALALATTPTQCSGSFATGIQANGNANCTTPDVIQLPETAQPAGIPNWGVFWFDSATHTPRVIDNNGQVVQLGLTNLFNSDPGGDPADNVEERNGTNTENFRAYSTYTNATTWQRTSIGFDSTDNYAVLRSENANTSQTPGLGFWIGSGLKWVVDATGNLKPWADNTFNLGSDSGNATKSVYAKTSFNSVVYGRNDFEIPNDTSTGTVVNQLAAFNTSSPSQAILASAAGSSVIGVVQGGAGKSGNAIVTWHGYAYCIFDNATTAGDAVVASTTVVGDCHDSGSPQQPTTQLVGYSDVTNATAGATNGLRVGLQAPVGGGSGGGAVSSVFGRTGAVSAQGGDYATYYPLLSGNNTLTGNQTIAGNLYVSGSINQTGSGASQWSGVEQSGASVTVPSGENFSFFVGNDNNFHCQLSNGTSCLTSGMVYPGAGIPNSTGSGWGTSYGTSGTGTTLALTASPVFTGSPTVPGYVPASTTVNGHALSANVTVSASDLTTGTLPAAQLPAPTCSWITEPTESGSGNAFSGTNKAIVWGVYNPYPCVTNNVAYVVGTADNTSNNYALGLYSGTSGGAGALIATTASTAGTTFAGSAGIKHIAWNATNVIVPAGRVYIALTSNCSSSCAALLGTAGNGVTWAANVQVSVSTGGAALPATVTLPTDSLSSGASIPALIVY